MNESRMCEYKITLLKPCTTISDNRRRCMNDISRFYCKEADNATD